MNVLVTGSNGQLGRELRVICNDCTEDNYLFTDVTHLEGQETLYLDVTDFKAVHEFVVKNGVKVIVNCAAWTNVDACEANTKNASLAEELNAKVPGNLAVVMKEVGGVLFHISTDYIFGKEPYNTPCTPERNGTPIGTYGATKKRGEDNIVVSGCEYIILRTAWLYSEFGKNFCETMLKLMTIKPMLNVVFDQCGTPTYAQDLAVAIHCIISQRKYRGHTGIYHYSNEGVASWYDFAKAIQRIAVSFETPENLSTFGRHGACNILPCYSCEYPSPVVRPAYSVLDKNSFKETFGIEIPYWIDSLERCIRKKAGR